MAAACQELGAKKAAVARRFCVSGSFVKDLVRRQAQTGYRWACPLLGRGGVGLVGRVCAPAPRRDAGRVEPGLAGQRRPVGQTCLWQVLDEHALRRKKK